MSRIAEMTDEQLERRVAKINRRSERQELQRRIYRWLEANTRWGKMATVGNLRAGAKLRARQISAAGHVGEALRYLRSIR